MPSYRIDDLQPRLGEGCWLAPGARVFGDVELGAFVSVWPNSVLRADYAPIRVGRETNIQDCCVLHVDVDIPLNIGERVIVGHSAILHGCTIEDEVLIGMGAKVLNGARIGRGCVIAAGALVREGVVIPPHSLVVGMPGIVKRSLPEDGRREEHLTAVARYIAMAGRYRAGLRVESDD